MTTRIAATVGVGDGVDGLTWGARVAGGGGGSVGADGTKTSVGRAAGVTIRATVCRVERHVGNVASAAPAAASARIKDQRREGFIGGYLDYGLAVDQYSALKRNGKVPCVCARCWGRKPRRTIFPFP